MLQCCCAAGFALLLVFLCRVSVQSAGFIVDFGSSIAPGDPDEWPTRLIRFLVKDTGIRISQPDLGKLFKSFSQVCFDVVSEWTLAALCSRVCLILCCSRV
jgi:hypothetical protein